MSNNKNGGGNNSNAKNNNKQTSKHWKQGGGDVGEEKSNLGTIHEFPILVPNKADGTGSNFYAFKKLFIPYIFKNYQDCGKTFDDDSTGLYFPPEVKIPEATPKQIQETDRNGSLVFKYGTTMVVKEIPFKDRPEEHKYINILNGATVAVNQPWALTPVMVDASSGIMDRDPFSEANDPYHIKRDLYKDEIKLRQKRVKEMENDYLAIFYVLWGNMSIESRAKVQEASVGFDEKERDVYSLWNAILESHRSAGGQNGIYKKFQARNEYRRLHMNSGELVASFKTRFDQVLENLRSVEQELPTEQELAIDFMEKLDPKRFTHFKVELANHVNNGIVDFPTNVTEMVRRLNVWQEVVYQSNDSDNKRHMKIIHPGDRAAFSTGKVKNNNVDNNKKRNNQSNNNKTTSHGKDNNKNNNNSTNLKDIICYNCGKPGHKARECRAKKKNDDSDDNNNDGSERDAGRRINLVTTALSGAHKDDDEEQVVLRPFDLLLDNQSTIHIFNDSRFLKNIRKTSKTINITGIGGDLPVDRIAEAGVFGTVYYHPQAMANIISFAALEDQNGKGCIQYVPSTSSFEVSLANGQKHFSFVRRGRLSICNVKDDKTAGTRRVVLPITVAENERLFTKREVQAAQKTRELKRILGFPSDADLMELLKTGIKNAPVEINDVKRASIIYGPDWSELKGKTVMNKPSAVKIDPIMRPIQQLQTLHVDIMFVEGLPFLISVCQPLGLVMVDRIPDRKLSTLRKVVSKHINHIHNHNFVVDTVLSDGEGGIAALQDDLLAHNIRYNPAGPGQHVPVVERKIRLIKERVRAHIHSLPFNLSQTLLVYLIYFVVACINMLPNHNRMDRTSPKELLTGRKINFDTDLRVGFGDYVHATAPNIVKNSMEPRTQGCIALLPIGNIQGSVKFLRLDTNKTVTRDQWKALPMPDIVISRLNDLADLDNGKRSRKIKANITDKINFRRGGPSESNEIDHNGIGIQEALDNVTPSDGVIPFIVEGRNLSSEHYLGTEEQMVVTGGEPVPEHRDDGDPILIQNDDDSNTLNKEATLDDNGIPSEFNDVDDANDDSNEKADQGGIPDEEHHDVGNNDNEIDNVNIDADQADSIQTDQTPLDKDDDPNATTRNVDTNYNLRRKVRQPNRLNLTTVVDSTSVTPDLKLTHSIIQKHFGFRISVKKALSRFGKAAEESMEKELRQLVDKDVFEPVDFRKLTKDQWKSVIRSHMFLKEKHLADGSFDKLKSRFVAGGDMQDKSTYEDISSSTASSQTVFTIAAIAASEERVVKVGDVPGAYLNSPMKKTVLMHIDKVHAEILTRIDPIFGKHRRTDGSIIVKLRKALYGCVESANLWYEHLSNTLISNGFVVNPYDECIFNRSMDSGNQCTVCVYVDDLMVTSKIASDVDEVFEYLSKAYGPITISSGTKLSYLGMNFDFGVPGKVKISMSGYVDEILDYVKIRPNEKASTPATSKLFEIDDNSHPLNETDKNGFHSMVAKLLYMAKRVRPDMLLAVSFLTTRVSSPTEQDLTKLTRLLFYLNDTKDFGLVLEVTNGLKVLAYIDASHGSHPNFKGHTGGLISLGHGVVHAKSSKQKLNSKSSTETELIGLSDYLSQVLWIRNFLIAQGYINLEPAIVFQDNISTITMVHKGKHIGESTRHINIRYFFIKHYLETKEVILEYLPTESMIADIMTKPLQGALFKTLRAKLLNL